MAVESKSLSKGVFQFGMAGRLSYLSMMILNKCFFSIILCLVIIFNRFSKLVSIFEMLFLLFM